MVAVIHEPEGSRTILTDDLKPTDALCTRWALEAWDWPPRQASPIYRGMRQREGAPQPGPPPAMSEEVAALDGVLAQAEGRYWAVVVVWYTRGGSVENKAKRLGTNRSEMYVQWKRTLE